VRPFDQSGRIFHALESRSGRSDQKLNRSLRNTATASAAWSENATKNRPRPVNDAITNRSTATEALQNSQEFGRAPLRRTKNPYRHNSAKNATSKRSVTPDPREAFPRSSLLHSAGDNLPEKVPSRVFVVPTIKDSDYLFLTSRKLDTMLEKQRRQQTVKLSKLIQFWLRILVRSPTGNSFKDIRHFSLQLSNVVASDAWQLTEVFKLSS